MFLAVVGPTTHTVHRLPGSGSVTIGRGPECDVVIDDASVSRVHARIDLGPPPTICDLGSSNGTRLRRRASAAETAELFELRLDDGRCEPIVLGEPMSLGSVLAVLHGERGVGRQQSRERDDQGLGDWVVASPEMREVRDRAMRIAKGPVAVLVCGETGVGKEVIARMVHDASPRASGPFVAVNCGALPEALAESELFGHEPGAFTGATSAKVGLFESAHGGTLFLDEVAELTPALQIKLLRVVEDRKVARLGGVTPRTVDVRLVSATHGDLPALVRAGRFRQDLWFRLNGMTLTVPPLRSRRVEIAPLARLFAARCAWAMGQTAPRLSPAVIARLERFDWPGNVRELRNVVERAVVLASSEPLEMKHLLLDEADAGSSSSAPAPAESATLRGDLDAIEKQRILDALTRADGNQTKAATLLGMPRRTLVTRLSEYGITRPRKR